MSGMLISIEKSNNDEVKSTASTAFCIKGTFDPDDITKTISEYLSYSNFDANKLQQLDERADFIKDLFRKYGGDYNNLLKYSLDSSDK